MTQGKNYLRCVFSNGCEPRRTEAVQEAESVAEGFLRMKVLVHYQKPDIERELQDFVKRMSLVNLVKVAIRNEIAVPDALKRFVPNTIDKTHSHIRDRTLVNLLKSCDDNPEPPGSA